MNKRIENLLVSIQSAFRTPTLKQKEAYGRFSHTISAACCIGAVTLAFSDLPDNSYAASKVAALVFWAVVLFLIGSILSKGE
jgi:dihydroorotase-like cyclic amidohydrolase